MKLQTLNETQILITFIALALLILFAYTFGTLFEKIKGPRVVGEILGGMVLGGSCLFILFPDVMKRNFILLQISPLIPMLLFVDNSHLFVAFVIFQNLLFAQFSDYFIVF